MVKKYEDEEKQGQGQKQISRLTLHRISFNLHKYSCFPFIYTTNKTFYATNKTCNFELRRLSMFVDL